MFKEARNISECKNTVMKCSKRKAQTAYKCMIYSVYHSIGVSCGPDCIEPEWPERCLETKSTGSSRYECPCFLKVPMIKMSHLALHEITMCHESLTNGQTTYGRMCARTDGSTERVRTGQARHHRRIDGNQVEGLQ